MITTAEEYQKYLWQLQSNNKPISAILLPSDENIYEIDLNTRTINAPEFLGIRKDHGAETIYFLIDRYFDNMDLSQTSCVIQYKNAAGDLGFFPVPFYDVTTFSADVSDNFLLTIVESADYEINKYYIRDSEGNYVISKGAYDKQEQYYLKTRPIYNTKYIKVDLTANSYSKNNFYCMDYDTESPTFGQYTQATSEFDQSINYFAKVDRRFVPIALTSSTYQRNTYYKINSKGNMEIATDSFNSTTAYYDFIDSPKMMFPWMITSDVAAEEGIIEFSVRFYVSEAKEVSTNPSQYEYNIIYNLNTQSAKSKVLYGIDVELTDEELDRVISAEGNPPEYWEFISPKATVLEDIYYRLNAVTDTNLYWIDAD